MQALLLSLGRDLYALPLTSVREVLVAPVVTVLPTAPVMVRGVINLRGDVLPLFDTAVLLGAPALTHAPYAVVVQTPVGAAGLVATDTPSVTVLGEPAGPSESPGTAGIYATPAGVATLLDIDVLLGTARAGASP
jgi:purine-binding chemotaxis protein CheW